MNIGYLLPPLVAAGVGVALLVVVLLKGRQQGTVYRVFSLFLFCTTLWAFFTFAMRVSPDVEEAVRWGKAILPICLAAVVFFYHFSLVLTNITKRRTLLLGGYVFLGVVAAISPTGLFLQRMEVHYYGYAPIIGLATIPIIFLIYCLSIMAIYNLVKAYRTSRIASERNRFLYIIVAMLLPMIGGIFDLFPTIYPTSIFGNIAFGALTAVAILKYHLFDIRVVIRKGVAYILASAVVAVPYVGLILLFNYSFGTGNIPFWVHLTLLLVLAFILLILWRGGQRLVDRWFYRERYDFLEELVSFSQETHDISDLRQLGSSLVGLLHRGFQASGVYLLLLSELGDFDIVTSTERITTQLKLKSSNPLLRWLQSNEGPLRRQDLDIIPQLQSLTASARNEIGRIEAELFIPLKAQKDELIGLLILSKKLSEQPYSEEDKRLILTVASRMAVELENARLYTLETKIRQELEKQNEQKTEFLHSVAHELKTPLTAIISSSELLGEESSQAHSLEKRLVDNIRRSALSMDRRVTGLLDLAKLQVGELTVELTPLDIGSIITEIASQYYILFEKKKQTLALEIPDSLPETNVDRERFEQVLFNLLSNANKFSPGGSDIILRVMEADRRITVEVEDSAPAVTEVEEKRLFEPYYRGEDADRRRRVPGLGLGLAISKRLVELHRGEMWVESKPGKGNKFAFSLPVTDRKRKESANSPPISGRKEKN